MPAPSHRLATLARSLLPVGKISTARTRSTSLYSIIILFGGKPCGGGWPGLGGGGGPREGGRGWCLPPENAEFKLQRETDDAEFLIQEVVTALLRPTAVCCPLLQYSFASFCQLCHANEVCLHPSLTPLPPPPYRHELTASGRGPRWKVALAMGMRGAAAAAAASSKEQVGAQCGRIRALLWKRGEHGHVVAPLALLPCAARPAWPAWPALEPRRPLRYSLTV